MAGGELQREIGRHDAQIEALQNEVKSLHADLKTALEQLASIQQTLAEARGGWKTMMWLGGLSAAVGGLVVKVFTWATTLPMPR